MSKTGSANPIETIPTEILDEVVCHLDGATLLNLCHALPRLKHISQAIFDVGSKFAMPLDTLWPDMWFPVEFREVSALGKGRLPVEPITFEEADYLCLETIVRLITRYRGSVTIPIHTNEYVDLVLPLLPKTINVFACAVNPQTSFGDFKGGHSEYLSILMVLQKNNISFKRIDVPYFEYEDNHILQHHDFVRLAKSITEMRFFGQGAVPVNAFLEFDSLVRIQTDYCANGIFDFDSFANVLGKHPTLMRVDFENLNFDREDDDIAEARLFGKKELERFGWTCVDGVGDLYGNPYNHFPSLPTLHKEKCLVSNHSHTLLRIVASLLQTIDSNPSQIRLRKGSLPHIASLIADPSFLFRFYFKCNLNEADTVASLHQHINWRLNLSGGVKLGTEKLSPKAQEYLNLGIFSLHSQDKQGRPTMHINLARYNATTEKPFINDFKDALVYTLEAGRRAIAAVNESLARSHSSTLNASSVSEQSDWRITSDNVTLIHQLSVIVDLEGVGLANINYEMMPILLSLFANHFPGIFGTLYVLNFGWLHSGIWSIVKRALSAEACKKLMFLTKEEMLEYFDADLLLSVHGGTCLESSCTKLFAKYDKDASLMNPSPHVTKTIQLIHSKLNVSKMFPHDYSPISLLSPASLLPRAPTTNQMLTRAFRSPHLAPKSVPQSPFFSSSDGFYTPLLNPLSTLTSPSMEVWFDAPEDISNFLLSPAMTPMQTPSGSIKPVSISSASIKEIWSPGMVQTLGLSVQSAELLELELPESAMGEDSISTVVEGDFGDHHQQGHESVKSPRSDGVPQTPRSMFLADDGEPSGAFAVDGPPLVQKGQQRKQINIECGECPCCTQRRITRQSVLKTLGTWTMAIVKSPWTLSLGFSTVIVDACTGRLFCQECSRRTRKGKKAVPNSSSTGAKTLAVALLTAVGGFAVWQYVKFLHASGDGRRFLKFGASVGTMLGYLGLESLGNLVANWVGGSISGGSNVLE
ncbi:UNVERIFIED_CONTAM: hypothetical protein HDU68_000703 [Siphonaria sp. JEL0065]|nr:hypothetical protein HDU68_000703 [Siphonaria sp. JEL0065]